MSTDNDRSSDATNTARVDMGLEAVVIPVSDVDRARQFYEKLGWRLDADFPFDNGFRIVQFTPHGSGCSVQFGAKITPAAPGSAHGLYLIVSNIEAARNEIVACGVDVSEVFHSGTPGAQFRPDDASSRVSGPGPGRASYGSFATFSDPDGNGWLLQEVTTRLPGRGLSLDLTTLTDLLRETEKRHGAYEPTAPKHNWADWYAAYIAARENGSTSDEAAEDAALHIEGARGPAPTT